MSKYVSINLSAYNCLTITSFGYEGVTFPAVLYVLNRYMLQYVYPIFQLTRRHLDNQDCVDTLIKSERTVWAKEKSNLQQALKLAEAELAKMKAEARNETLQTELFGSGSENIALKVNLKEIHLFFTR